MRVMRRPLAALVSINIGRWQIETTNPFRVEEGLGERHRHEIGPERVMRRADPVGVTPLAPNVCGEDQQSAQAQSPRDL